MFTGLVAEVGTMRRLADGSRLRIGISAELAASIREGDSISVAGVCLTAGAAGADHFEADVVPVTLERSSLGALADDAPVNLEPALRAGDRLGGHIVQGHVDGVGRVESVEPEGNAVRVSIAVPAELRRYLVERGSIAVDGASITVAECGADGFVASLIPETRERTTLGDLAPGSPVNLEVDVIARYVERLMQGFESEVSA